MSSLHVGGSVNSSQDTSLAGSLVQRKVAPQFTMEISPRVPSICVAASRLQASTHLLRSEALLPVAVPRVVHVQENVQVPTWPAVGAPSGLLKPLKLCAVGVGGQGCVVRTQAHMAAQLC